MNLDLNLVRYACVAHSLDSTKTTTTTSDAGGSASAATILAEYNPSGDTSIHELAQKCLIRTPAYHSMFNHNIRGTSYTLLIEDPFVIFAISDEVLRKSDRVHLLSCVKDALRDLRKKMNDYDDGFTEYCFQDEIEPLFGQLKGGEVGTKGLLKVNGDVLSYDSGSVHSSGGIGVGCGRRGFVIPKKKQKLFKDSPTGEVRESTMIDDINQISNNAEEVNGRENDVGHQIRRGNGSNNNNGCSGVLCSSDGKQKVKKMWRKHVWIVLFMDMAVCFILFGIWLMICQGFQCLHS